MTLDQFLEQLKSDPTTISFDDTQAVIDQEYVFTPTQFENGAADNAAGENSGSCKLFAFAVLQNLSEDETLACFGDFYQKDVLGNPDGEDHQNIRQFMAEGWAGISFEEEPLKKK